MKQQKIFFAITVALLLAIIAIQLFVKQRIKMGYAEGESGVFLKSGATPTPAFTETETITENL